MPDPVVSLCTSPCSSSGTPWDCRSSPFGGMTSLVWHHAAQTWFPFYSILFHTRDLRVRTSVPFSSVHSFISLFRNIEVEGKLRKENQNSQIINHGIVLLTEHWFCVRHFHVCMISYHPHRNLWSCSKGGSVFQICWVFDTTYNCLDTGYLGNSIILLI